MSWIEARVTGRQIDPATLNPYRQRPARPRGPVSEAESRIAWELLGRYLRGR